MTCSPARLAANRANSALSTGPRTEAGKAVSRGNALKHGLSGAGVVVAAADLEAVERLKGAFERELGPRGEVALGMVHRAAVLASRLERCGRQEVAALAERVVRAEADYEDGRLDEVDRLMGGLLEAPGGSLRRLARMPEGVDRLVETWLGLRDGLEGSATAWGEEHRALAEALTGRRRGALGSSAIGAMSGALRDEGASAEAKGEARSGLLALIDEAVAWLREHREGLDLGAIEAGRAGARDRALFDPSKEATLARRYEAATERGLFRTLKELATIEGRSTSAAPAPARPLVSPEEAEALRRQLDRAEAAVAEVEERAGDRAALGSFRAEPIQAPSVPRDPAERARRPDPRQLKRALKDERRGSREDSRGSGRAVPVPTAGGR